MIDPIRATRQPEPSVSNSSQAMRSAAGTSVQKSAETQTLSFVDGAVVTVEISDAAVAAVKATLETAAQEAVGGDLRAQRLLATEAAAKG
jgi:hypothetical protein